MAVSGFREFLLYTFKALGLKFVVLWSYLVEVVDNSLRIFKILLTISTCILIPKKSSVITLSVVF